MNTIIYFTNALLENMHKWKHSSKVGRKLLLFYKRNTLYLVSTRRGYETIVMSLSVCHFTGRVIHQCVSFLGWTLNWAVPSASISWWTLKIPQCPSWKVGKLLLAPWPNSKFLHELLLGRQWQNSTTRAKILLSKTDSLYRRMVYQNQNTCLGQVILTFTFFQNTPFKGMVGEWDSEYACSGASPTVTWP